MTHRVLVVGTGSIGERHVRCLLKTGRAEVAICEPAEDRRKSVCVKYDLIESFASLDDAFSRTWDAAVVATPAHLHIPIAQRIAEKGIHLLIEKPLSITTEGVSRLIETVCKRNLVAGVAYVYRTHPGVEWLREVVMTGKFGNPVQFLISSGQHFPLYRPAYREIYYAHRDQGGGAVQDGLTHFLNLGEFLLGPIRAVVADADHCVLEGVEVEDTVHVLARHGRVMAGYTLNQHQAPNETIVTLVGIQGTARFDLHENRCRWMQEPGGTWNDEPLPRLERDDWFVRQVQAFLDAIEGKKAVLCSLEEGLQTLRVVRTVLKSMESESRFLEVEVD